MKKMWVLCLAALLALVCFCAAEAEGYTDESGISFPYPDGWTAMTEASLEGSVNFGFKVRNDWKSKIEYFRIDWWAQSEGTEMAKELGRDWFNADYLSEDLVAYMVDMASGRNLRTEKYGEVAYCLFDTEDDSGNSITGAITMDHGYLHVFRLISDTEEKRDARMPEFTALLSAVRFPASGPRTGAAGSVLDCYGELREGYVFSRPQEVTVVIWLWNIGDEDFPGPLMLYDPDLNLVEELGETGLAAGESLMREYRWNMTKRNLTDGEFSYYVRYPVKDESTGELTYDKAKKITFGITWFP